MISTIDLEPSLAASIAAPDMEPDLSMIITTAKGGVYSTTSTGRMS